MQLVPGVLLALVASASISWALVYVVRRYALRRGLVDHPNSRSSHTTPTPRFGGLGVVPALLVTFAAAEGAALLEWKLATALAGLFLIACVGWLDDRHTLAVGPRLAAHIAGSAAMLPLALTPVPVPAVGLAAVLWWVIWGVASVNVVNFMDGIDGLVGAQALVFGVHLLLFGDAGSAVSHLGIALGGTALGFLWWNWAPAKIFLGDGGSGALGLAMTLGGLLLLREGKVGLATAYLPLYPLFLDATVTLLLRAARGERLTQAHRSHFYQRLANGSLGHSRVSLLYAAAAFVGLVVAQIPAERGAAMLIAVYFLGVPVAALALARTFSVDAAPVRPRRGG